MEDWKAIYASKLTTADEAVRQIPNGSRVFFGHAANEPPVLVDALVRNYEQYKDVEIVHWVPMGKGEYCDPKMKGHLRHNAMFVGPATRKAVQEGRADYTPFFYHQSTFEASTLFILSSSTLKNRFFSCVGRTSPCFESFARLRYFT